MRKGMKQVAILLLCSMLAACIPDGRKPEASGVAVLEPVGATSIRGRVTFGEQDGLLRIFVDVTGLTGEHALLIRAESDCRSALAALDRPLRNASYGQVPGELPNIRGDVFGTMRDAIFVKRLGLRGTDGVLGRTLVLMSRPGYSDLPPGRAGPPIACGVIVPI